MLYTVTVVDQIDQLTLSVNKMMLQRDVVEAESLYGDEYFFKLDRVTVGIPSSKNRWDHKMTQNVYSIFKIMAKNVSENTNFIESLVTIQYFGNGNFSMKPDFTSEKLHEIDIGNETFLYSITNKSEQLSKEHQVKEQLIFQEFFKRLQETRKERLLFPIFTPLAQEYTLKYSIFGEIVSCHGFGPEMIYVEYQTHLPPEWKPDPFIPNQILSAKSQVSISTDSQVCLGVPFEYHLVTTETICKKPSMYFKVKSVDMWARHTVVGYGYCKLPIDADREEIEIHCWKPDVHFQSQLKNYFIGGCPDIQDMNLYEDVILVNQDKIIHNHYGFKTETSGVIKIRYQIATQQFQVAENRYYKLISKEQSNLELDSDMDALQRAKLRLKVLKAFKEDSV